MSAEDLGERLFDPGYWLNGRDQNGQGGQERSTRLPVFLPLQPAQKRILTNIIGSLRIVRVAFENRDVRIDLAVR